MYTQPWLLDAAIVAILIVSMLIGGSRGLLKSLLGIVTLVLALVGASWVSKQFTEPVTAWLLPKVTERLTESFQNGSAQNATGMLQNLLEQTGELGRNAASVAVSGVLTSVVHAALYLVSFFVLWLVLQLLSKPLRLLEKAPLIGGLNTLCGAAVGLAGGILLVCVVLWASQRFGWIPETMVSHSFLSKYFTADYLAGWLKL